LSVRHVTLHQLRIFTVLARHLNMTRAAHELHQTPAALSIQIKQLAAHSGAPLYEQIGKKLYLTANGEAVERAGRDILRRLESLTQELDAHRNVERGLLRLSIISTAEYFAPRLAGAFCKEHPGIEVHLEIINRDSILERLKQNLDDILHHGPGSKRHRRHSPPLPRQRDRGHSAGWAPTRGRDGHRAGTSA